MLTLPNDWNNLMKDEYEKPYFQKLMTFLEKQYRTEVVYPAKEDLFTAFKLTPYEDVRVVIVGQDPYHNPNEAHGLSFSVREGVKIPPSLKNMYKELVDDIGCEMPTHGNLTKWAKQGVLLLNTVLTVRAHAPNSHKKKGWEQFTDAVIQKLVEREDPIIFVLWGKPAQEKEKMIAAYTQHTILKAPHPSPLSSYRGFFGSKPYSTINRILKDQPIDWSIS